MNLRVNEAIIIKTKKGRYDAKLGIKGGSLSKYHNNKKSAILWFKEQSKNDDIKIKFENC